MPSWFVKTKRAQSDTDDEGWAEGAVHPTLNVFDLGDVRTVAIVVDTFPIQNTVIGRSDTAGPQGRGHGDAGGPMFTLDTGGGHAVAVVDEEKNLEPAAYDEFNDSISPVHHTLRAGTKQSTGVLTSVVRRLTPTECERLQGFPDDWTLVGEKSVDSSRYKQMGNAVTTNVIAWIGSRL